LLDESDLAHDFESLSQSQVNEKAVPQQEGHPDDPDVALG
jgi:hypothetical protein